jgi:hypothetical protein
VTEHAVAAAVPKTTTKNASVALGSGSGAGALVVWLVGLSGTQMPPEVGAVTGGVLAALFLFVAHHGLKGTFGALWKGTE